MRKGGGGGGGGGVTVEVGVEEEVELKEDGVRELKEDDGVRGEWWLRGEEEDEVRGATAGRRSGLT